MPAPKPTAEWLTFNPAKPKTKDLAPLDRALVEEWCNVWACPVFYDGFFSIGLGLEHDETPEVRIDIEKLIAAMEGSEFDSRDQYEAAAGVLERAAALMRQAGEKHVKWRSPAA